jgi:sodium-dependent dicarboxylate transporter 2/3/5
LILEPASIGTLAGILLLTIIWWIVEPIPIALTGFLPVTLCIVLGAVPADPLNKFSAVKTAFAPFADPASFFLLGGMFLGCAMMRHGLDRRLALSVLTMRWSGRNPTTLLCSLGAATSLVSMWISNTAATAMIYPVALGIVYELSAAGGYLGQNFPRSRYASMLLLITSYASTVGGVATPIGTSTNVVAMGYFRNADYFGRPIDFLRWCTVGVPLMLALFIALLGWMSWLGRTNALDMAGIRSYLHEQRRQLGNWNRCEKNTLLVFLIAVSMWIAPGILALFSTSARDWFSQHFPEEAVALLIPVLLYLLPTDLRNRQFSLSIGDFAKVDWGTMMLFGAGLSLGSLMSSTGLAVSVAEAVHRHFPENDLWVITALAIAGGILLSEITSNAATAIPIIPVVFSLCNNLHDDSMAPLLGVTFGASFGNALPVSTPPNAIVYGSGLIRVRRMVFSGLGIDLIAGIVIWCALRLAFALGWTPLG